MKKNYILLLLIIIVGVFIMTSIGIIYKKVDNSKENKSYISNKVNNYEYKDIESGMNEIKDNGYLYLTYIGSKNIYNLEKYIYKTLKNNKLSDKFIYINCTDNINDKKIINDLEKYINGNYQRQLFENIDFKILVKDTILINSFKEQSERYLFTLENSRLFDID